MQTLISYLTLYRLSDGGLVNREQEIQGKMERILLPAFDEALRQMQIENRPFLIRQLLRIPKLYFKQGAIERLDLQRERLYVSGFFDIFCLFIFVIMIVRKWGSHYLRNGRLPMTRIGPALLVESYQLKNLVSLRRSVSLNTVNAHSMH